MKLKPLTGSDIPDDYEISPDLAVDYYNKMLEPILSDYIASAIIPGTDDLGVIDFSNNDTNADTNKVLKSQTATLNLMGGAEVLSGANITSAEALKMARIVNTRFALSAVVPQLEAWVEMVLNINLNNPSKVHFHMESPLTKADFQKEILTAAQNGLPNALTYNTLNGFSEKDTMAMLQLQDALGIPDKLVPLSTSYTQSKTDSTTSSEPGRPEKDSGDLTDSGDRMRNQ